jgi:hypothetical protein
MTYLYGDSTDSGLELNYIELLRDFLDFAVQIMLSEQRIDATRGEADRQKQTANAELERLRALGASVAGVLDKSQSANKTSVTDKSIATLRQQTQDTLKRAAEALKASVAGKEQKILASKQRERAANSKIAERLLLHHDLPDSENTVDILLNSDGTSYQARVRGACKQGLRWLFAAEIPSANRFYEVLKVSGLEPELHIDLPEMSGLLRKQVKLKPYRETTIYITAIQDEGQDVVLKLRSAASPTDTTGLDVRITPVARRVSATRLDKGEEAQPHQLSDADAMAMIGICEKLKEDRKSLVEQRAKLLNIRFDGKELSECPDPKVLLKRLMDRIGPVIQNIADHSLADTELVLKRVLANDRREEIFASRADLLSKIKPVPIAMRGIFAPLGLGDLGTGEPKINPNVNSEPHGVPLGEDPPTKPLSNLASRQLAEEIAAKKAGDSRIPTPSDVPRPETLPDLRNLEDEATSTHDVETSVQEITAMAPDEDEDANLPPIPRSDSARIAFKRPTNRPPPGGPKGPPKPPPPGAPPPGDSIDVALAELDAEG